MSLVAVLLASSFFLSFAAKTTICSDAECTIIPEKGDTVACDCSVKSCILDCSGNDNCQDIKLYSTAVKTTAICDNKDSCKQSAFNINNIDDLPDELADVDFDSSALSCSPNSFKLECLAESSCKDVNVTATSISKVSITADAKDAFDESRVDCSGVASCKLTCSNTETSCDDAECNDECKCNGKMCPGWTESPTSPPVPDVDPVEPAPAPEPVPDPVYVTCDGITDVNGVCELSDLKGGDVVVVSTDDGVDTLIINCKKKQQCQKNSDGPLVVFSGANNTEMNCGKEGNGRTEQSCMDAQIFVGDQIEPPRNYESNQFKGPYNSVTLNCYGKQSCKEANLTVNGEFTGDVIVMAMGADSYQDSKTECDIGIGRVCSLKCNEDEPQACGDPICDLPSCQIINMPMRQNIKRISAVDVTTIVGTPGATVILDSDEQDCRVDCSGVDSCKKDKQVFTAYVGCNRTVVDCTGKSACKEASLILGVLRGGNVPEGKTEADFDGPLESLEINCGESGCEDADIVIEGEIKSITINGEQQASLKNTDIICRSNNCNLNCGQLGSNADSCKDLNINCASGCSCTGGSCMDIKASPEDGTRIITPSPTAVTPSPTPGPTTPPTSGTPAPTTLEPTQAPITPKPSPAPTSRTPAPTSATKEPTAATPAPTTGDIITYTGNGDEVFICKNNVGDCILDCNNAREQCSGKMVVLSGANSTKLECDAVDACKSASVYVGSTITQELLNNLEVTGVSPSDFSNSGAEGLNIDCQANTACSGIKIQVNQALANGVTILAGDEEDALKQADIDVITASCTVDCGSNDTLNTCEQISINGCDCSGSNCPEGARISGITNIPNNNDINGVKHYPTFLQMIMIGCVGFGLMCLIGFFVYYKFFGNESINGKLLSDENINYNVYNTFNIKDARALEMESYLK